MKKIIGIYALLNEETGKYYIGKSVDIDGRIREHMGALRNGIHHSIKLQRSHDVHGFKVFKPLVLEECTTDLLDEKERYYVDLHNSYYDGYNCCIPTGENCGRLFTDEDKEKHSIAMKLARSKWNKADWKRNNEALEKARQSSILSKRSKQIDLYDSATYEHVKTFTSYYDCADFLGVEFKTLQKVMTKISAREHWTYKNYIPIKTYNGETIEKYLADKRMHEEEIIINKLQNKMISEANRINKVDAHIAYLEANREARNASWKANSEKSLEALRASGKKAIGVYLKDSGEYIGKWALPMDFANEYNIKSSGIHKVLCGEKKSYMGYVFSRCN